MNAAIPYVERSSGRVPSLSVSVEYQFLSFSSAVSEPLCGITILFTMKSYVSIFWGGT